MSDIGAWLALGPGGDPGALEPGVLVAHLEHVAALGLTDRWPHLAGVAGVCRHSDARVRAAAAAALAGVAGLPGERLIVAALGDGEAHVRAHARVSLAASAVARPELWVHGLVHRDPDERAVAVAACVAPSMQACWLRALGDVDGPAPDVARKRLERDGLQPAALPVFMEHVLAGHAPMDWAMERLAELDWGRDLPAILESLGPSRPHVRRVIADPDGVRWEAQASAHHRDGVDTLVRIIGLGVAAAPEAVARLGEVLLRRARRGLLSPDPERRLAVSVLVVALCREAIVPTELLAIATLWYPGLLALPTLDLSARRAAVCHLAGLVRPEPHDVALPPAVLRELVGDAESLDLAVVASLVAMGEPGTLSTIARHTARRALVDALVHAPVLGAAVITGVRAPPDADPEPQDTPGPADADAALRSALVRRACERHGTGAQALFAELMVRDTARGFALAKRFAGHPTPALLAALDAAAGQGRLREARHRRIAELLLSLVGRPELWIGVVLAQGCRGPLTQRVIVQTFALIAPGQVVQALGRKGVAALAALDTADAFLPWAVVAACAAALKKVGDPVVEAWVGQVQPHKARQPLPPPKGQRSLSGAELATLRACGERALARALAPALDGPVLGLTAALADRTAPSAPHPEACAALLLSADPLDEVAIELARHGLHTPGLSRQVDALLVARFARHDALGPGAAAWLYRWDLPLACFSEWVAATSGGALTVLQHSLTLPAPALRAALWQAVRALVGRWRYHDRPRLRDTASPAFVAFVVGVLGDRGGASRGGLGFPADPTDRAAVTRAAAEILMRLRTAEVDLEPWRSKVDAEVPRLPPRTRAVLQGWLGSADRPRRGPKVQGHAVDPRTVEGIERSTDLALLGRACRAASRGVAELAALRLLELDEPGAGVLLDELCHPQAVHLDVLAETVPLWPDGAVLAAAHARLEGGEMEPGGRFHLAVGLAERADGVGEDLLEVAVQAALAPSEDGWLHPSQVARLAALTSDPVALAVQLCASPQHPAHAWAVDCLVPRAHRSDARAGLRAFLVAGADRAQSLRVQAAEALRDEDDATGAAVLAAARMRQARARQSDESARDWAERLSAPVVLHLVQGAMIAGSAVAPPAVLLDGLDRPRVVPEAREPAALEILRQTRHVTAQRAALEHLDSRQPRTVAARRMAEIVLWGRDQSRKLLGRTYRVELIGGEGLGWTRLEGRSIHVNPVPLLRGERDGAGILRGLVVHELGHHLYNADERGLAIWKQANDLGLARLHNLVCDEHLERNLRAIDAGYGDDLKRLGAWAFQHASRAIEVHLLFDRLGPQAMPALVETGVKPARTPGHVEVGMGRAARALAARGARFSDFFRALRLGRGNRSGDPLVGQALALFGKDFRGLDNDGLWAVTRRLAELFGDELPQLDMFDLHATAEGDDGELLPDGRGVTKADVDREVDRFDRERAQPTRDRGKGGGRDAVNVGGRGDFDTIDQIEVLPHDPAAHAALAAEVARPARQLRQTFATLGLAWRDERPRSRGYRVDRARLVGSALRGDPRVLVARRRVQAADLFVGIVVDCSGSMTGRRMDTAVRFATLLAESCRGLPGVDLRIFGFTHQVIYDAGTAERCAAHALEAGGGNNDAAGLAHAAQHALRSRRTARLLVMISDGLPTECSTTALRALVTRLQRRHGIALAQIAVAQIVERCFDTYIEVVTDDVDAAVRRFGRIVARLVTTTVRS